MTAQREGKGKAQASVNEIWEDEATADLEDNDNNVAAFNRQGAWPKTNQSSTQSNRGYSTNWGNSQAGSRFNQRGGPAAETTQTGTTNSVTFARYKDITKRNAGKESRRTNLAVMPKDKCIGPESTSWRRIKMPNLSMQTITQKTKSWKMTKMIVLT